MKIEKTIASWLTAALMLLNVLPQVKNENVKTALIYMMITFTIFLFALTICKKKNNGN